MKLKKLPLRLHREKIEQFINEFPADAAPDEYGEVGRSFNYNTANHYAHSFRKLTKLQGRKGHARVMREGEDYVVYARVD